MPLPALAERRKDYCGFPECITGRNMAFALYAKNILMIINKNPDHGEQRVIQGQCIMSHQFQPDFGFTDSRSHLLR